MRSRQVSLITIADVNDDSLVEVYDLQLLYEAVNGLISWKRDKINRSKSRCVITPALTLAISLQCWIYQLLKMRIEQNKIGFDLPTCFWQCSVEYSCLSATLCALFDGYFQRQTQVSTLTSGIVLLLILKGSFCRRESVKTESGKRKIPYMLIWQKYWKFSYRITITNPLQGGICNDIINVYWTIEKALRRKT